MDRFNREIFGYKKEEVNRFVGEVIEKTENLLAKTREQERIIESLQEQIIHYQTLESDLRTALKTATENQVQLTSNAYSEARRIIKEARKNADRIVSDALIKNEKLELLNDSTEKNLKRFKNRLRTIIEQQVDIVDEIEDLEMDD